MKSTMQQTKIQLASKTHEKKKKQEEEEKNHERPNSKMIMMKKKKKKKKASLQGRQEVEHLSKDFTFLFFVGSSPKSSI